MLLRLVSPVKRSGSSNHQFQKRVPKVVRDRMIGRKLVIPLGEGTITTTVDKQGMIRFSLGTPDPTEAKARQGEVLAYLERLFRSECDSQPIELSRRLAVALSRFVYEAWIDGEDEERSIAFEHGPDGWRKVDPADDPHGGEETAEFRALAEWVLALGDGPSVEALEQKLGPLVDRVLALPEIMLPRLTSGTRAVVLAEFARSLRDAWEKLAHLLHRPRLLLY